MSTQQFNFTDEEFIAVLNVIIKKETMGNVPFIPISSMEDTIDANNLDSLGIIVFFVWLSEIFGICDAKITAFTDTGKFTVQALKEFVVANQTQTYTYQEALGYNEV